MSRSWKAVSLAILLAAFASVALATSHQEPETPIYVWINQVQAQPGQGDALVQALMQDGAIFDQLVDSGAAAEWGIAMPATHSGGDSGIRYQWVTLVGWAGGDQFMQAFMAKMGAMSDEERMAEAEAWETMVVAGSHVDIINQSIHSGNPGSGTPRYINLSYRTAKPGKSREAVKFYKENVAPVYDGLVADGAILNYGLHVPEVRQGETWTHMGWSMAESLAARDAVSAAFSAQMSSSPDEAARWQSAMAELFEREVIDQILMVVHHKTPGMADDGGDGDGDDDDDDGDDNDE